MSELQDRRAAQTIGELDLHLSYVQRELGKLVDAVADMATKQDIRDLEQRMSGFATKDELTALRQELQRESVSGTFDRGLQMITKIGAAVAVLAGGAAGVAALVHFLDRVPK